MTNLKDDKDKYIGPNIDPNSYGQTLLHIAVQTKKNELMKHLLSVSQGKGLFKNGLGIKNAINFKMYFSKCD